VIRLESVRRVFGAGAAGVTALRDVTLQVEPGEFVAVAGPSGSGKTSLLHLVGAIDQPTSGRILVDGADLAALSETAREALRLRRIGFVFQRFNLVPVLSAQENVELPLIFRGDLPARQRRERAARALERVGLGTARGRRPADLSGGEQQRVAVARALAGEPALILADEPTASLDHETGGAVVRLMRELNRERGTTFLFSSHDPELIGLADRVIHLRDGCVQP